MNQIDIVIPYYNGSKFIDSQLKSIESGLKDSQISYNLIVVDDCSAEAESSYLQTILPTNAKYIKNNLNLGVIKSVEVGLKASSSEYIFLCDQDDFWLPQKVSKTVNLLTKMDNSIPNLVYTDLAITDRDLNVTSSSMADQYQYRNRQLKPSILFQNVVTGCTVAMNRKMLEIALPFPNQITMHDHWLAICAVFSGNINYLNEPTLLYRQHGGNQVGAPSIKLSSQLAQLRTKLSLFQDTYRKKIFMAEEIARRTGGSQELSVIISDLKHCRFFSLLNKKMFYGSFLKKMALFYLLNYIRFKDLKKR